jgi:hypothetical protein
MFREPPVAPSLDIRETEPILICKIIDPLSGGRVDKYAYG